jgi:hypothetical protein
MTVHELRRVVRARDKFLATSKPVEEALALLQEAYGCDADSAAGFLGWLRGAEVGEPATKAGAVERVHVKIDPQTGEEVKVETQPGSIPPRP